MALRAYIHRVDIETPASTVDSGGRPTNFVAFRTSVPCRVKDLTGRELADAKQIVDQVTHVVCMRGDRPPQTVKAKMRIQWLAKTLEIHAVLNPDGRGFEIEVYCVEVANA